MQPSAVVEGIHESLGKPHRWPALPRRVLRRYSPDARAPSQMIFCFAVSPRDSSFTK